MSNSQLLGDSVSQIASHCGVLTNSQPLRGGGCQSNSQLLGGGGVSQIASHWGFSQSDSQQPGGSVSQIAIYSVVLLVRQTLNGSVGQIATGWFCELDSHLLDDSVSQKDIE